MSETMKIIKTRFEKTMYWILKGILAVTTCAYATWTVYTEVPWHLTYNYEAAQNLLRFSNNGGTLKEKVAATLILLCVIVFSPGDKDRSAEGNSRF